MFVGCSEICNSVIVKHVQHVGIIRAFCLPRGTYYAYYTQFDTFVLLWLLPFINAYPSTDLIWDHCISRPVVGSTVVPWSFLAGLGALGSNVYDSCITLVSALSHWEYDLENFVTLFEIRKSWKPFTCSLFLELSL